MNTRTALIHHFKQFPNRKILLPFLEWVELAVTFSQKHKLPLVAAIEPKSSALFIAINEVIVFQHSVLDRKHTLALLQLECDLDSSLYVSNFKNIATEKAIGLASFRLSQELLENPILKNKWLKALELSATIAPTKKVKINTSHNDWITNIVSDTTVRQSILKEVGRLPKYQNLFPKAIQNILYKNPQLKALQSTPDFWFEKGRNLLLQFDQITLRETEYAQCLLDYQASSERFDIFVETSKNQTYYTLILLIGKIVAHIESKATNKNNWNTYSDNRTVAQTGIRQHLWVQQLIYYKKEHNSIEGLRTTAIKKAVQYLRYPAEHLPILSSTHQKLIAHHLLECPYIPNDFTLQLISYFNQFHIQVTNFENYTYLIHQLLYHPDCLPLWLYDDEEIYQSEIIAPSITEPFQKYTSNPPNPLASTSFPLNQILYGPSGTGKTFEAIRQAVAIIAQTTPSKIKQWDQEKIKSRFDTAIQEQQIVFTTFHQSMSYEDFLEGIKPILINNQVQYHIEDGIFKAIVEQAIANPSQPYVLVIDEMNRGNTANILGELITLLEKDKRLGAANEIQVKLPYSKKLFGVPNNLYIIGTMNTVDKSTEQLDIALRRRFVFTQKLPDSLLLSTNIDGINIQALHQRLNERLSLLLNQNNTIGHTYFMSIRNFEDLQSTFIQQILPLLSNLFYDDYHKIALVLGQSFVEVVPNPSERLASITSYQQQSYYQEEAYQLKQAPFPKEAYISIYQ